MDKVIELLGRMLQNNREYLLDILPATLDVAKDWLSTYKDASYRHAPIYRLSEYIALGVDFFMEEANFNELLSPLELEFLTLIAEMDKGGNPDTERINTLLEVLGYTSMARLDKALKDFTDEVDKRDRGYQAVEAALRIHFKKEKNAKRIK